MVTKDEITDIALLSKLSVADDEIESLCEQMSQIIEFADTVNSFEGEIDEFDNINGLTNVFRPDTVVESYERSRILSNVNGGKDGYFPVKKIL